MKQHLLRFVSCLPLLALTLCAGCARVAATAPAATAPAAVTPAVTPKTVATAPAVTPKTVATAPAATTKAVTPAATAPTAVTPAATTKAVASPVAAEAVAPKSVIFLIGDGMGLAYVSAASAVSAEPLAIERAQAIGLMRTSSANAYVTDSAAAGTALSSGQKTNNGVIGQNVTGEAIPSMLVYAAAAGKSTGVVATSTITHATPAAFYGHNKSRRNEAALAKDLLAAQLDVAIGGGAKFFKEGDDGQMLTDRFRAAGYTVATTLEEVQAAGQGKPLLGLLAEAGLPKATSGRGPMLAQSTAKALELLGANEQGFILMVEGSQIDWAGHGNDWEYALAETLDFDAAVKVALDYADAHPDTLVVITADHETGGLSLVGGSLAERTIDPHWGSKNHTASMVPVYAYGAAAELFSGVYENTDVFFRILAALGLENAPVPEIAGGSR